MLIQPFDRGVRGGSPARKFWRFAGRFKQNLRETHDVPHTDRTVSMRRDRMRESRGAASLDSGEGGEGGRDAALAHRDVDDTLEQRVDLQVPAAPVQRPPLEPRRLPATYRLHLDYISATSRLHLG